MPALLACSAISAPALAQEVARDAVVHEVVVPNLNAFVGSTLFGFGHANLGVVTTASSARGVIGVTGRHGEFALISVFLLTHDGLKLYAPTLTTYDIKVASDANFARLGTVLAAPHVIVVEPPIG